MTRRRNLLSPPPPEATDYWSVSRGPLHSLVFIAPLLAGYEINAIFFGVDILARSELQEFLYNLWPGAGHLSAALVVAVLLAWHAISKAPWKVRLEMPLLMAVESIILALPMLVVGLLGDRVASAAALETVNGVVSGNLFQTFMTRVGAGIYEEFIFRLAAFNLMSLLLVDMLKLKAERAVWIILATTSLAFAWRHFPGMTLIDWPRFITFALCGAYLGGVYLLRGFGLAVGAHVSYNVIATLMEQAAGRLGN